MRYEIQVFLTQSSLRWGEMIAFLMEEEALLFVAIYDGEEILGMGLRRVMIQTGM